MTEPMEGKKRLLIVQEAMGGCGRNVVDIVNGIDHSKFDVTVAYGTNRIDDYYRNAIPEMEKHATLIPIPELVRDLSAGNDIKAWLHIRRLIKQIRPDILHCHSSKAGIIGLTKSSAKELAARNVRVNAVAPGFIDTEMTKGLPEEQKKLYTEVIPLKRLGRAEEVADAVAFLASPRAAYITGQVLSVNGGMYC